MKKLWTESQYREHYDTHNRSNSWWMKDANGIECCRICDEPGCEEYARSKYREEIFTDIDACDENIEED